MLPIVRIHPVKRGRWYWLDIRINGHRSRKSTGTTSKDLAHVIARQKELDLASDAWGLDVPPEKTLNEVREEYILYSQTNKSPSTVALERRTLDAFVKALEEPEGSPQVRVAEISPTHVEEFKVVRSKTGLSRWTVNRDIRILHTFFNFAMKRGYVRKNPVSQVEKLRVPKRLNHHVLAAHEIERLLREAAAPVACLGPGKKGNGRVRPRVYPLYDMILLALNTGLRVGELLHLEWEDVDWKRKLIWVRNKPAHQLKDLADRHVPLNEPALGTLARLREMANETTGNIFRPMGGLPIDRSNAFRELKCVAVHAGVPQCTWHSFRRTFATVMAQTLNAFQLRQIMGHSSVRTTEQFYIHMGVPEGGIPPVAGPIKSEDVAP
jgi:integrase